MFTNLFIHFVVGTDRRKRDMRIRTEIQPRPDSATRWLEDWAASRVRNCL